MIKIYEGISQENKWELYSDESMRKLSHDHFELRHICHPMVKYYSVFSYGEFMGAYMVIESSPIDFEAHMMLLPKIGVYQRKATRMMADILFEKTDRITTVIIDGMETAKNHVKKIGFKLEGIKRESFQVNGVKKDGYIYGLLKTDLKGA